MHYKDTKLEGDLQENGNFPVLSIHKFTQVNISVHTEGVNLQIDKKFSTFVLANKKLRVRVKAAAQQRPNELAFAFALHFPCIVKRIQDDNRELADRKDRWTVNNNTKTKLVNYGK